MAKITLVTGNNGKVSEFERILGIELNSVKLVLPEVQKVTVEEVAELKAEAAYNQVGTPVVVDDTGLTVNSWGRLPGAFIAWFLEEVGNDGVLKMLAGWEDRSASVITAIGYCDENGTRVFTGAVDGSIASEIRGHNGFGYDPIFIPSESSKTFAEMTDVEKDDISMRRIALNNFKAWYDGRRAH